MRLSIKIPKNHSLTFWNHPDGCTTTRLPGLDLGHLDVPWEWLSGPKLKIYAKTTYLEHFSLYDFFCLLMTFETSLSKKCPFWGNLEQKPLFASTINTYKQKITWKQFLIEFRTSFVYVCWLLGQKLVLVKIVQKWTFFTKWSLKNHKEPKFFYRMKNAQDMWFSHRFSILGPKVTPKGPPDGLGLTLAV